MSKTLALPQRRRPLRLTHDGFRVAVPVLALAIMLIATGFLQPRVMSYFGFTLLLRYSLPLLFATMAQLCILVVGDIDLGIGPFV